MMTLDTIIAKEQAFEILQKPYNVFQRKRDIEHVEVIYLPYYLFEIEIVFSNNIKKKKLVCVDGIDGEYAFIEDPSVLKNWKNKSETTYELKIDKYHAENVARKAVKDIILMRMKKGIKVAEIKSDFLYLLNYPYWIGLFRKKKRLEFDAIDALTGQKQGIGMRPVLIKRIMQ